MEKRWSSSIGFFTICFVFAILLVACAAKPAAAPKPAAPKTESANLAPGLEQAILDLVNQHRQSKKLSPLQNNELMESEARRHSLDMATKRVPFGHQGLNIRMKKIQDRIGVNYVAENVAFNQRTAREVVDSWLKSPGHRANIEGNYRLTGIGVARDRRSQIYYTQIFAR